MAGIVAELVMNSRSRGGGERSTSAVVKLLKTKGIDVSLTHELQPDVSVKNLVAAIVKRRPELLIIAGGDGTISTVAGHLSGTALPIALLPLGTTNNFARSLSIPPDIPAAADIIMHTSAQEVDLGIIESRRFINVIGIGASAHIANSVSDDAKRRWGRLAYVLRSLSVLLRQQPFDVSVADKDGKLRTYFKTRQLIIANGGYHAGRSIANNARPNNQRLLVFTLGGSSRLSLTWHMLLFYSGHRRRLAYSSYMYANDIVVHTDTPQLVEVDGEVFDKPTPARVRLEPRALLIHHERIQSS